MGVYETALRPAEHRPGMHWQHPHERYATSSLVYDPSRDLSPNLPVHSSDSSSMTDVDHSSSNCSTPTATCLAPRPHAHPPPPCNNNCGGRGFAECGAPFLKLEQATTPTPTTPPSQLDEEVVVCAGCGHRVQDRFYLQAVDRRWHAACLQCCQCRLPLEGEVTCFSRDGNIYCKKDYYRIFGMKRCARCQAAILSSELVLRARDLVFHVHCFTCAVCHSVLTKGEQFGMRDGSILCRLHYELSYSEHCGAVPTLQPPPMGYQGVGGYASSAPPAFPSPDFHRRHSSPLPIQPPTPGGQEGSSPSKGGFFNGNPTGTPRQKGRPRKRKPKDLEASLSGIDLNADYLDAQFGRGGPGTPGMPGSNSSRTKRMRTSFKHHQLRTMKSYFAINHNPDAKDLKQLSQKTGLPKRVLQVWFQNARAKWRRLVLKQEGKSGDKICSGSESGGLDLESYSSADFHPSMGSQQSPPYILGGSPCPSSLDCS